MENKSQEKAKLLLKLAKNKAFLEDQAKELGYEINSLSEELHELMVTEGIDSIEIDGVNFKPEIKQGFKLISGGQWDYDPDWFGWLKKTGNEGLIKVKESVHPSTRNSFLKTWIEGKNPLPDFIEETFYNTIKYNQSAIKRMVKEAKE